MNMINFKKVLFFALFPFALLCVSGCGMGIGTDDGLPEGVADAGKVTSAAAGAVKAVYLVKDSTRLSYLVEGRPISEAELMTSISEIAQDTPDAVVAVIATTGVSSDEANYVAAKVRAKGMANVVVSSTQD